MLIGAGLVTSTNDTSGDAQRRLDHPRRAA